MGCLPEQCRGRIEDAGEEGGMSRQRAGMAVAGMAIEHFRQEYSTALPPRGCG